MTDEMQVHNLLESHGVLEANLKFVRESLSKIDEKMDAFFRRIDQHEKDTNFVKTEQEVMKVEVRNLEKEQKVEVRNLEKEQDELKAELYGPLGLKERLRTCESAVTSLTDDMYGEHGVKNRMRANETKLTKVFAIGGAAMTALGAAAILIPMIWG